MKQLFLSLAVISAAFFQGNAALADAELIMVEEHGCMWCERWNDELSEINMGSLNNSKVFKLKNSLHRFLGR